MYLNRSRFDQLRGRLKGLIVAIAKNRVYDGVKKYFRQVKERLEAEQVARNMSKNQAAIRYPLISAFSPERGEASPRTG